MTNDYETAMLHVLTALLFLFLSLIYACGHFVVAYFMGKPKWGGFKLSLLLLFIFVGLFLRAMNLA